MTNIYPYPATGVQATLKSKVYRAFVSYELLDALRRVEPAQRNALTLNHLDVVYDRVQRSAGPHRCNTPFVVREIVSPDIHWFALRRQ